jgi:hypothetical protein
MKRLLLALCLLSPLGAQTLPYTILPGDNVLSTSVPGMNSDFVFLNGKQLLGTGAPSATCSSIVNLGYVYVRTDAGAISSSLYSCDKTGVSTYAWEGPYIAQLPVATTSTLGVVEADGTTIHISGGVISAVSGGAGTVAVVGAGNLAATLCTTGGGSQTIQTPSANCTVDASGNIIGLSFNSGGPSPNTSGILRVNGKTSGGQAFVSADVGGTLIALIMPTTNPTANQILADTGSATCPTLPSGSPTTCHQLSWTSAPTISGANITAATLPHSAIAATAVTPGSYTSANITVAADGTVTAAANGSGGGGPTISTAGQAVLYPLDAGPQTGFAGNVGLAANVTYLFALWPRGASYTLRHVGLDVGVSATHHIGLGIMSLSGTTATLLTGASCQLPAQGQAFADCVFTTPAALTAGTFYYLAFTTDGTDTVILQSLMGSTAQNIYTGSATFSVAKCTAASTGGNVPTSCTETPDAGDIGTPGIAVMP